MRGFWAAADNPNEGCRKPLSDFNKVVAELGPLIKVGQVNLSSEADAAAKAREYGIDAEALAGSPCKLEILLAPFDDKGEPEEWQHFKGSFIVYICPSVNHLTNMRAYATL
jgi:hypothetical protein